MSNSELTKAAVPQRLIELFGTKELAEKAANLALMYGEYMQEAAIDFYWYKQIEEKKAVFKKFVEKALPVISKKAK